MKRPGPISTIILLLLFSGFFLFSANSVRICDWTPWQTTIIGTLESVATDAEGRPSALVIFTRTEEYLVAGDAKGEELAQLLKKQVRVRGEIEESKYGEKIIHVTDYQAFF